MSVTVWYILMEPFAGGLASLLILTIFVKSGQYVAAEALVFGMPVWKAALVIHITAWIIQFIGHGIFEGILSTTINFIQKSKTFCIGYYFNVNMYYILQDVHPPYLTVGTKHSSQRLYLSFWKSYSQPDIGATFMIRWWKKLRAMSNHLKNKNQNR